MYETVAWLIICSRFGDIPSPWWQASTVLVGTGSALSLLVAVTAMSACCITYVIHTATAKIAGTIQLLVGKKAMLYLSICDSVMTHFKHIELQCECLMIPQEHDTLDWGSRVNVSRCSLFCVGVWPWTDKTLNW